MNVDVADIIKSLSQDPSYVVLFAMAALLFGLGTFRVKWLSVQVPQRIILNAAGFITLVVGLFIAIFGGGCPK